MTDTAIKPAPQPVLRFPAGVAMLAIGFTLALLFGCESTSVTVQPAPTTISDGPATAEVLLERARSADAEDAALLYLDSAWNYLENDDARGAAIAFSELEPGWLDRSRLADYHLLATSLALAEDDLDAARTAFAQVPTTARTSLRAIQVQAALCARVEDEACGLPALVRLAAGDVGYNEQIWAHLHRSTSISLLTSRPGAEPEVLAGWRELHRITVTSFSVAEMQQNVNTWLNANPQHPAALAPPAALADLNQFRPAARHIGLLLPLSGPLARAGEAVRDGYIAASLLARADSWMTLSIYDSTAEPVPTTYERMLADGVDFIVGPLQKDAAAGLNALNPDIPTLVLNYLDADISPAPAVLQMGLAIEDEAATIAARLEADQISSALLFHNYDDWSLRARRALVAHTEERANPLALTIQPFTDMRTITEAVGTAMHVSSSRARKEQLASTLGIELEFLPRAREDVNAVVALIDNVEATALVPALRFHFANQLPVYASSQATRRTRDSQLDELDGFLVSELPWFIHGDPIYTSMRSGLDLDGNPFASLVALGSDAFRVADRTGLPDNASSLILYGSIGLLRLETDGRLARELAWGQIDNARINRAAQSSVINSSSGH